MYRFVFIFLFLLVSCSRERVSVFYEFVTTADLASVQIDTPDPRRERDDKSERLFVSWRLPRDKLHSNWDLLLVMRYRDHSQEEVLLHLEKKRGTYVFNVSPEAYLGSGGLLAYKAELKENGVLFDQWKHILWVDLIEVEDETTD
jgi:hypothetical protein